MNGVLTQRLSVAPRALSCEHVCEGLPAGAPVGGCAGHAVVGLEDEPAGAVLTEVSFLVLTDHEEGVENMFGFRASQSVHVEECGVEIGAQQCPTLDIPPEGRSVVSEIHGVRLQPP